MDNPNRDYAGADQSIIDDVKDYYGKKLKTSEDLKTNACMTPSQKMPAHVRNAIKRVHDEVIAKYYGCGLIIPECLEDMNVLDLGSGSGRDCYILSQLVGEKGHVTGIDMTDEQLEIANKFVDYHAETFGYKKPNTRFVKGYIEKMGEVGLQDGSMDMIVSNCVVNLSPDKPAVIKEAYRLLKPGGELYFSDVYADRDLPEEIRKHKVLWGECIAGALWWKDLVKLAGDVGFSRPRIVTANVITVSNAALQEVLGDAKFVSVTYSLFKVPQTKTKPCQVIYNGTVTGCETQLKLDYNHIFKTDEIYPVDEDIATILKSSRFAEHFTFSPCQDKGTCAPSSQGDIVDPFEYLEKCGNTAAPASCCGVDKCC